MDYVCTHRIERGARPGCAPHRSAQNTTASRLVFVVFSSWSFGDISLLTNLAFKIIILRVAIGRGSQKPQREALVGVCHIQTISIKPETSR